MSFIPVLQYIVGVTVFGFVYWLLDGIMDSFIDANIHMPGYIYNLLMFAWAGCLLIYLIFGGWWVVRKYAEEQYMRRG